MSKEKDKMKEIKEDKEAKKPDYSFLRSLSKIVKPSEKVDKDSSTTKKDGRKR